MARAEMTFTVKDIPEVKAVIERLTAERDEAREKLRTLRAAAAPELHEAMRMIADYFAECRHCGQEHKPRPHPKGEGYADTFAAEDGHYYRARQAGAAEVLRREMNEVQP